MQSRRRPSQPRGFTLIELLVVIGIIVLLAAILLPVVSQIRKQAYNTSTQGQMQRILQACESYYHDFNSYPGPIANVNLSGGSGAQTILMGSTTPAGAVPGSGTAVTSSENLVLGLLGYLDPPPSGSTGAPTFNNGGVVATGANPTPPPGPPPHDVLNLNPLRPGISYHYIDYVPDELSTGKMSSMEYSANGTSSDSNVPEFVDRFPEHLPILYIRAFPGGGAGNPTTNPPVSNTDVTSGYVVQYNFKELKDYGSFIQLTNVTAGKPAVVWSNLTLTEPPTLYSYYTVSLSNGPDQLDMGLEAIPYNDWYSATPASGTNYYFNNPNIGGAAVRGKDGFLLICAGKDHTFGTIDDTIITP